MKNFRKKKTEVAKWNPSEKTEVDKWNSGQEIDQWNSFSSLVYILFVKRIKYSCISFSLLQSHAWFIKTWDWGGMLEYRRIFWNSIMCINREVYTQQLHAKQNSIQHNLNFSSPLFSLFSLSPFSKLILLSFNYLQSLNSNIPMMPCFHASFFPIFSYSKKMQMS